MSRRHADNWSHPGHYLVDPYTWPWSPNGHGHGHDLLPPPLCNVNRPSHSEIQLFQNFTMKIHGQGHVCSQRSRSGLTFKIQRSRLWSKSNPLVTFEAWSSTICLLFVLWQSHHFWLRYRKFRIWPWKSRSRSWQRSNLMVTFEALELNQYVCFSFRGNRTIFGSDIANSIFDLENSGSRSWPRSNPFLSPRFQSICLLYISVKVTMKTNQNLIR